MFHLRRPSRPNKFFEEIRDRNWTEVTNLCKEHPRLAKSWARVKLSAEAKDTTEMLPLHVAVLLMMPDGVEDHGSKNHHHDDEMEDALHSIQEMIKAHPQALSCKEGSLKRTPLHLACQREHPSVPLINILLNAYPDATKELDQHNRLPLHYACATNDKGIIEALLDAYPEAADLRDGQGWLALHVACHYPTDFEIIQMLLRYNPDAVIAVTPMDLESPLDLVNKQNWFKDRHEIMDLLAAKEKYYKPTTRPYIPSFVSDNVVKPIY